MTARGVAIGLVLSDLFVLISASWVAMLVKFGLATEERTWGPIELTYPQLGLALTAAWCWALSLSESRSRDVLGGGLEEYRRLGRATLWTFGTAAVLSVLLKIDFSRGYVAVALPVGLVGLLLSRWTWRRIIRRLRSRGHFVVPALVVGSRDAVDRVSREFESPLSGHRVVAGWAAEDVFATDGGDGAKIAPALVRAVGSSGAKAVVVTDPGELGHEGMRALRWALEEDVEVLVSQHLVDVSPERLALTFVGGQPLVKVEEPSFARAGGALKAAFDRFSALILLILFSPVLLGVAAAVKISSPGPVFFRQVRIGRDGAEFMIWKFRSMRVGADADLRQMLEETGTSGSPLFKPKDDPRITAVGRFIRRTSLDEVPQLLNVLNGTMSLVGPRPQVPEEVALYRGTESLRLRVLPGVTGLWQVSGRSRLTWQEAARLDLYYVENWSMLVDLVILWRTVGVVLRGEGAR
ncbi:sugar transferase [Nocardioides yefusunii]|uniref:Sugar transferase n=1 Tax=Nocardioides yefusunii TaxID=2500546 RepID=A0ABW1QXK8_9ACTN|nr:sugar transferase [Nocardioides yefusunii]